MNKQETAQILAVLKVAYPNFYKNMTEEEATAVIGLWESQLEPVPYKIVGIAVNKLIATNIFPPTIAEVRNKIIDIGREASVLALTSRDEGQIKLMSSIATQCRLVKEEPSILSLTQGVNQIETYDKSKSQMPLL